MWQKIYETIKLLLGFSEELQRNRTDIEKLQQEMREITAAMQRLIYELQRAQENEAHEREKLALRWEIEMLRSEKQLPSENPTGEDASER